MVKLGYERKRGIFEEPFNVTVVSQYVWHTTSSPTVLSFLLKFMSTRAAGSTFLLVPRFHTLKRSVLVSVACSLPCQLCREVHQRGCILFQPCRCNHHSKPLQFVCSTPMRCGLFELIEMHALHPLTGQAPHQFDARAHTPPNHFACTCMLPCF